MGAEQSNIGMFVILVPSFDIDDIYIYIYIYIAYYTSKSGIWLVIS